MSISIKSILLVLTLLLSGCAATVNRAGGEAPLTLSPAAKQRVVLVVQGSETAKSGSNWEEIRTLWKEAMTAATTSAHMGFEYRDTTSGTPTTAATMVNVQINDYRYISQGARFAMGVMLGNAFMDADIAFVELPSGKAAGTRKFNTQSSGRQGIFSAMTDKQIRAMCEEIVRDIRNP